MIKPWVILLVLAVLSAGTAGVVVYGKTRGLRNNNPGNIRHGSKWQGMSAVQKDKAFVTFDTPEYGIRAMNKVLDTYRDRHGLKTVRGIIGRWAPPNENDTESYIRAAAKSMGVTPDQHLTAANRPALIAAIIKHENGLQPYDMAMIERGVGMA